MNIALYGGSFDPPHIGHLQVVHAALKALDIDKLIVVPAFVNPFKMGTHAPAHLRLSWLRTIFADDVEVEVSDLEVSENRAVTTIETVEKIASKYAKIYFIIGADNLASLQKWHRFEALNNLVTWVVATRDGIAIDKSYQQLNVEYPISSSQLRSNINDEHLPQEVASEIKTYYEVNHAR